MIIYDIEIKKAIPSKNPSERLDGIEYCDGWNDHANMGISVIGVYDYVTDRYRVFCEDNFGDFVALVEEREVRIGYNNKFFDDIVLILNGLSLPDSGQFDLLQEIWAANGSRFSPSGLDPVCEKNFGTKKTGNGALAPVEWQRGNVGKVIDYCLNDVAMKKQLVDLRLSGRPIISPKDGKELFAMVPGA